MKKIIKLFILIFVCFIPLMVDAKSNLEFKDVYENKFFLDEKNGEYFYIDPTKSLDAANNVVVYAKNGKFLRRDSLIEEDSYSSLNSLTSSKYFDSFYKLYLESGNRVYDEENGVLYEFNYFSEEFRYYNSEGNYIYKGFNDDLEFTKKLLGKKYDAYLMVKENDVDVYSIIENNGYFVAYYLSDGVYASILDKNLKVIKTFGSDAYDNIYCAYVYDDLIYAMTSPTTMEIYKLDGSFLDTLTISHESLENADGDSYNYLNPYVLYIKNNELFIMYNHYYDGPIPKNLETNDFFMDKANIQIPTSSVNFLTLVYNLNYDVNKVETSNGDFTYESKFDDEGREYVELKITPLKGYNVEDIIVTDINGKRIEVTNNKFYMPASDVRIEVKFGEYIPIPDTFSNISPLIKIISVILIGCGMCVIGFSLKHKKA